MDNIVRTCDGNHLRIAIKRPAGLQKKWSEKTCTLGCNNCGSTNITTDMSSSVLVIACHDCPNYALPSKFDALCFHISEEACIRIPDHFDKN